MLWLCCCFVFLFQFGHSDALTACMDTWVPFQGSCYYFAHENSSLTFAEAVVNCKSHGAHIVYIETELENLFLEDFTSNLKGNEFWIGLTDEFVEGVWEWHGTDVIADFTDWAPGEPNDRLDHEDCAIIWQSNGYHWNDATCTSHYDHICETEGEVLDQEFVG